MKVLFGLGRFLQLLGLIVLPIAITGNVANPDQVDLRSSLALSTAGVALFVVGWLLQQATRAK